MPAARVDWDAQPLGEEPDTAIARRLGVCPSAAYSARKHRGIPAFKSNSRIGVDWDIELLGVETDREIADRLGICISTVKSARKRRGIPRPPNDKRPGTPEVRKRAAELRRKGWTLAAIGEVYGVTETAVLRWFQKDGVS